MSEHLKLSILFFCGLVLQLSFPLISDDHIVSGLYDKYGLLGGIKWFWEFCNPRLQNVGVFIILTGLEDVVCSMIMVWFVFLVSRITGKDISSVCATMILVAWPSMWTDGWLWVSGCMNYLLGMCIVLQAIYTPGPVLAVLAGLCGELFGPAICLYYFLKKEYKLLAFSIAGTLLFLASPGNWNRAGDLGNEWFDIAKMTELWKPILPLVLFSLYWGFRKNIFTYMGLLILMVLTALPYGHVGLNRVFLIPVIFIAIPMIDKQPWEWIHTALILAWLTVILSWPKSGLDHKLFLNQPALKTDIKKDFETYFENRYTKKQ